ncbi:Propanediol utilization protein PduU [Listeria monocytogenes SHL005]|uniref:BMC domain-containing protein n=1 Tax=Listeria monocytogenes TaxID=1639 RepID=UPI000544828E|nr:BMC domain-containing protein [Listeria monocytogenes]KHK16372.1 Propanediol utilization protein PduU [Listeria monocytogenes SHL005]
MSFDDNKERVIQEYVPGKQVTLAHLIANPNRDIYTKLGLEEGASAIGILTITPSEASIIASDIATKSGDVRKKKIGFIDRFSGSVVLTGDVSSVESALQQVVFSLHEILDFSIPKITRS